MRRSLGDIRSDDGKRQAFRISDARATFAMHYSSVVAQTILGFIRLMPTGRSTIAGSTGRRKLNCWTKSPCA